MLNENEIKVLKALEKAHSNAGGDFAYADEIVCDLSVNQVKGYLSKLQKKEYITISEEYHQINFLKKSIKVIPNLSETCNVY